MKTALNRSVSLLRGFLVSLLALASCYTSSAFAMTTYQASGSFFGDLLEATRFDEFLEEDVIIDAVVGVQPFDIASSTFTLDFTVDESIRGRVPVFSPAAFFDGAVTDITLAVNGVTVFSSVVDVATPFQSRPVSLSLAETWGFSFFPDPMDLSLPDLNAFDFDTFEDLGSLSPQGFFFNLSDSTRSIYAGQSIIDMIMLDLNDFDSTTFQLFWQNDTSQETEFGDSPPDLNYTVFARVDSLTSSATVVPVPAAAWLFGSALIGFLVVKRRGNDFRGNGQ